MPKIPLNVSAGEYSMNGAADNTALNMVPIPLESAGLSQVVAQQPPSIDYLSYADTINGAFADRPKGMLQGWGAAIFGQSSGVILCIEDYLWFFDQYRNFNKLVDNSGNQIKFSPFPNRVGIVKFACNGTVTAVVDGNNAIAHLFLTNVGSYGPNQIEVTAENIGIISPNYSTVSGGKGGKDVAYIDGYFCFITDGGAGVSQRVFHGSLKTVNDGKDFRLEDFQDLDTFRSVTGIFEYKNQLVATTTDNTYFFQNTGNVNFAFQLLKGQTQDLGVLAYRKTTNDVVVIGVGNNGKLGVYLLGSGKVSNDFIDRFLEDAYLEKSPWAVGQTVQDEITVNCIQFSSGGREYIGVTKITEDDPVAEIKEAVTYVMDASTRQWHRRETRTEGLNPVGTLGYFPLDQVDLGEIFVDANRYVLIGWGAVDASNGDNYYLGHFNDGSYIGDFANLNTGGVDFNSYEVTTAPVNDASATVTADAVGCSGVGFNGSVELLQTEDFTNYISQGDLSANTEYMEWRRLGSSLNLKQFKFNYSNSDGTKPYTLTAPYAWGEVNNGK